MIHCQSTLAIMAFLPSRGHRYHRAQQKKKKKKERWGRHRNAVVVDAALTRTKITDGVQSVRLGQESAGNPPPAD